VIGQHIHLILPLATWSVVFVSTAYQQSHCSLSLPLQVARNYEELERLEWDDYNYKRPGYPLRHQRNLNHIRHNRQATHSINTLL